jgi:tricorn protease
MKASIDPREEWSQIFNEAWRIERIFSTIRTCIVLTGLPQKSVTRLYCHMSSIERIELYNREMISELNSSHTIRGGDIEGAERYL